MAGLVLKLRPGEEILVNGVVLQNGERSARLTVRTPDARILRLRDAIAPADATTPLRKLCLHLQLAVAGRPDEEDTRRLTDAAAALARDEPDPVSREMLDKVLIALDSGNHYAAWRAVRRMVAENSDGDQPSSAAGAPGTSSSAGTA